MTPTGLSTYDDEPVSGWMLFAGTVLGLAGLMRLLDSFWAFRYDGALPDALKDGLLGDKLTTYAWVWLIVAVLLIVSSWLLLYRSQFARWVGFVAATIGALSAMTWMPYYPIWSMTYVAMFVLTFYALAAHGGGGERPLTLRWTVTGVPMSPGASKTPAIELEVGDRDVRISNPDRVYFPATGATKLDLAHYYLSVGDGIVNALRERPCMLHRFPKGVAATRCTRSACRPEHRPGSRPCASIPAVTTARPTNCASPSWPASSGRSRCPRSSSTRGTAGEATPRSPTSGGSTWIRCRCATLRRSVASPRSRMRCSMSSALSAGRRPAGARGCTSMCASSHDGVSRMFAVPRWRLRERWSGAHPMM